MEAARLRARERLGTDVAELTVVRHGRELYGGLFGFFQRERFVIELEDPQVAPSQKAFSQALAQQTALSQKAFPQALAQQTALSQKAFPQSLAPETAPPSTAPSQAAPPWTAPPWTAPSQAASFEALPVQASASQASASQAAASQETASRKAVVPGRLAALLESTTDTVGVSFDRELQGVLEDAEAVVSDAAGTTRLTAAAVVPRGDLRSTPAEPEPVPSALSFGVGEATGALFSDRLAAAGLAEEYLPDPLFSQPALALPLRLGVLPPPRPVLSRAGDVLVLVGDVDESLKIAQEVARRIDEDETVLVVSHRRLPRSLAHARARSPIEAGAMVLERRLAGLVSIVVLDSGCRDGFVPTTVAGIRPEMTWGVVPASWDEKRARGLEALVGHLDALALYGLVSTDRPAGLVGRAWPVAYVDGWEASPLSIAARLVEAVKADM